MSEPSSSARDEGAEAFVKRVTEALDPERAARRVSVVLDALEAAFDRHRQVHPGRVLACEMCDLRGRIAAHDLLERP